IRTVERLVTEWKVGDDIVLDRRFKQRPLKPRGVAQMAALDPVAAQAKPDQYVATKSFDHRHAFVRLWPWLERNSRRSFGKLVQDLIDQRKRLFDLAHPDPDARVDVALAQNRHVEAQGVIGRVGEILAGVER